MYIATDISNTMQWIVNMFITGFTNVFNWLASFEFAGTNLLMVIITITILGAFIPVLLSIPNSGMKTAERYQTRMEKKKK